MQKKLTWLIKSQNIMQEIMLETLPETAKIHCLSVNLKFTALSLKGLSLWGAWAASKPPAGEEEKRAGDNTAHLLHLLGWARAAQEREPFGGVWEDWSWSAASSSHYSICCGGREGRGAGETAIQGWLRGGEVSRWHLQHRLCSTR